MSVTSDINYWVISLKSWVSRKVNDMVLKEKYGDSVCECTWNNILLATSVIDAMQYYTPLTYSSGTTGGLGDDPVPSTEITNHDFCLTDANEVQIKKYFQIASSIVNNKKC